MDHRDRVSSDLLFWAEALEARSVSEFIAASLVSLVRRFVLRAAEAWELQATGWTITHSTSELSSSVAERRRWIELAWEGDDVQRTDRSLSIPWKPSWIATNRAGSIPRVIVIEDRDAGSLDSHSSTVIELTKRLGQIAAYVERSCLDQRELTRLEAVLREVVSWSRSRSTEEVLEQIAQSATRLLECERATIFLWDKARKKLVGRPALGVPGNLLEVPDHVGVVGRVLHEGEPICVTTAQASQGEVIHRGVDRKLGFHTRNLLGVPLENSPGSLKGVFEVLNRERGEFTSEDISTLQLLAQHAAAALVDSRTYQRLAEDHRRMVDQAAERIALVGEAPTICKLREMLPRIARADLAVLVLGENGTGKDIVAQQLHYMSSRRDRPWLAINCASIASSLLESELFGHEKGAFTGAHEVRIGKFEAAMGGTVFLDEIGDLSLDGQAALLRVLEDKTITRIGGVQPISVDTRVIAATNRDLAQWVREGRFREDLYYRLNVVTLELPPLRQRGDDVLLLARHFLDQFAYQSGRKVPELASSAQKKLLAHDWPGNVRELRNLIERLIYLCDQDPIEASDISFTQAVRSTHDDAKLWEQPLTEATRLFQRELIERHIAKAEGNVTEAAKSLGLHRSNLYRKMQQLGMPGGDSQ